MGTELDLDDVLKDAKRWRWLRAQGGWPETEAAMLGATPEDFDRMADANMKPKAEFSGICGDDKLAEITGVAQQATMKKERIERNEWLQNCTDKR